jgi:hypothetical protein
MPCFSPSLSRREGEGEAFSLLLVIPAQAEMLYNGEAGQALHNSEAGHPL